MSQPDDDMPASFYDAIRQLEELKAEGVAPNLLDSAYETMEQKVTESATSTDLYRAVEDIGSRAVAVAYLFTKIEDDFTSVDSFGHLDNAGNPVPEFQPTWAEYKRRFNDLLQSSGVVAGTTRDYVKEFVEDLIPLVLQSDTSLEEKKSRFHRFITVVDSTRVFLIAYKFYQRTNPNTRRSRTVRSHTADFGQLIKDVKSFTARYIKFAKASDVRIADDTKDIQKKMEEIEVRLSKSQMAVMEMSILMGVTVAGTVSGSVAALSVLGPEIAGGIVAAGLSVILGEVYKMKSPVKAKREIQQELEDEQSWIQYFFQQSGRVEQVKSTLDETSHCIAGTFNRLDDFATIWDRVVHDAKLVREWVSKASDGRLDDRSRCKVLLMKATYSALYLMLDSYHDIVHHMEFTKQVEVR